MTDEAKLQLLNYVVNNIEPTVPNDDEIFLEQGEIDSNTFLNKIFSLLPENTTAWRYHFEGMIEANELTSNLSILYGGLHYTIDGTTYTDIGLILLLDENFNIVKGITKYSSGTYLRYIQEMRQAEDGTFYLIDDIVGTAFTTGNQSKTSQKRFVMTNNFTFKSQLTDDYEVVLRISYIFGSTYRNFYCKEMIKDGNSSHYIFFGQAYNDNTNTFNDMRIIELKVNVGMPNEWTMLYQAENTAFGGAIALFEDTEEVSNVKFRAICSSLYTDSRSLECVSKTYTGNVVRNSIISFDFRPLIDSYDLEKQCVFLSYDDVYFIQNNQHVGLSGITETKQIGLYKYSFDTNTKTTIYENSLGNYDFCNIENLYITKCNTDIYLTYCNNITNSSYADYYFQRLVNDTFAPIQIAENKLYFYNQISLFVKASFNLLQIFIYGIENRQADFQYYIKEDYNSLNYNGTPYIDYDCLVSKKGQIYSENKIVFARNLYNKYINNATTMSTIQIPNNYLNGINLDLKKLISNTNFDICNESNITNKNIYEMVFVNYINTISVLDEDTGETYNDTANYVNTNINTGTETNCNNTFIGKVRINFSTPQVQLIQWTWNVDHYETSFTIYTSQIPSSIEFISNDETTTYITKILEFEANKFYTISQKLRIE